MDIVLFGIQGSGKGTIAKAISEQFGYSYFEAGAQLRELAQTDSPLGQKVKSIIDAGNLVPSEIVIEMAENFLTQLPNGKNIIFDGFPRKAAQAEALNKLMEKYSRNFVGILINVPQDIAKERLIARQRKDDNNEAILRRFQGYLDETIPVIENYQSQGKIIEVDGTPDIPTVRDSVFQVIEKDILATS